MADLVPIPLDLFDRLRRAGLDVDAILRRAKLPRSRFSVSKPQGSTAEFFALWRAVEEESDDPGLGLRIGVEVLPDEENVVSLAAMHSATLNRSGNDGTITRFGWKAQNKSLTIFAGEAYNVEQGVTNLNFPDEREDGASNLQGCMSFNATPEDNTDFTGTGDISDNNSDLFNFALAMQLSKPPTPALPPGVGQNTVTQGSNQFVNVGCANCHTPTLTTAASTFDPALSNVTFHPYSDFAVHNMGTGLSDGITQGNAGPQQFRSAPLWGVGQRLFFLHDGRTTDLTAAIAAHSSSGSEANAVISNFNNLSESDQQAVLDFLRSL
jgi:CxxC motif-containing protein (DUF1111 family)